MTDEEGAAVERCDTFLAVMKFYKVADLYFEIKRGMGEYRERVTAEHAAGTITGEELERLTREWKQLDTRAASALERVKRGDRSDANREELERALEACATFLGRRRAS